MKNLKVSKNKGFSLVELLVVIAVIGVIAAIAIPAMTGVFSNSRTAKAKRNAQNIASTFAAAQAAGYTATVADEDAAVTAINTGVSGSGAFSTSFFQVSLDTQEATAAKGYLSFSNGTLKYDGTDGDL